ncbi:MAG: hypothetical protein ABIL00_07665 [candidate division WOR-3 bacterium]
MRSKLLFIFALIFFSFAFAQKVSKEKATKAITDSLKGAKVEALEYIKDKGLYEAKVSYNYKKLRVTVDGTNGKIAEIQELEDPIFSRIKEIVNIIAPGEIVEKSEEREEDEITYILMVKGKDKMLREIEVSISVGEPEEEEGEE